MKRPHETAFVEQGRAPPESNYAGPRDHFCLFNLVRPAYLDEPYPAWTAVEVAGLRRDGAIVEIRVGADNDPDG